MTKGQEIVASAVTPPLPEAPTHTVISFRVPDLDEYNFYKELAKKQETTISGMVLHALRVTYYEEQLAYFKQKIAEADA